MKRRASGWGDLERRFLRCLLALSLVLWSPHASATCIEHPLSAIGTRLRRLGEPAPLLLLGGAVLTPFAFIPTGADHGARVFAQGTLGGRYDAERMSLVFPYSLTGSLAVGYGLGLVLQDCATARITARALQAMGVSFLVMGASKFLVGRTYPAGDPHATDRLVDEARARQFEPFRSFGAWPSGHAATTFAFAAVLRTALGTNAGVLRYGGYVLAVLVSGGMVYSDRHWASDIVSGALLGEAIGRSVGREGEGTSGVELVPSAQGVAIVGAF